MSTTTTAFHKEKISSNVSVWIIEVNEVVMSLLRIAFDHLTLCIYCKYCVTLNMSQTWMENRSPLPFVFKWSQNIPDTGTAILRSANLSETFDFMVWSMSANMEEALFMTWKRTPSRCRYKWLIVLYGHKNNSYMFQVIKR